MNETAKDGKLMPKEPEIAISMAKFLESCPPNQTKAIEDLISSAFNVINTPEIQLYCSHESCTGLRYFRCTSDVVPYNNRVPWMNIYLIYRCSNCLRNYKTFSLGIHTDSDAYSGRGFKFGEIPAFGSPTPPRLIKLIGPDKELFLKGRRCENQGLGIGAFTYYRRMVENQKNRILDEIIKVASKLGNYGNTISELEAARREKQFSKALENIKQGIPEALMINGNNPLLLLHDALSEGVHQHSDEECLELASSARIILIELADRLSHAVKDDAELNKALTKLTTHRKKKTNAPASQL